MLNSNEANWNDFDRLLAEASSLSLEDQYSYDRDSVTGYESEYSTSLSRNSTLSSTSTFNSTPSLSRNSTLSSTSTLNSNYSFHNNHRFSRDNALHKPHALGDCSSLPKANLDPIKKNRSLGPEGCFVPCKETHTNYHLNSQPHFITPIFAMAGRHYANILSRLFNYDEPDPFTVKQDDEQTMLWEIENVSSLLTLSHYTYQRNSHSAWKHLADNLGRRQGITSILVVVSYHTIKEMYTLLDHLVHSLDQAPTTSCSWWSRLILVIDDCNSRERKLFLTEEIPKVMARYKLDQPLTVLFIHTSQQDPDYKISSQRILRQMMDRHLLCGNWMVTHMNDNNNSSSSDDDDMYTMATVIEYKDGKRKRPPKNEKANCYSSDD